MFLPPKPYPLTPKSDQIDDYHGTLVPDPYRWLEDASDPKVRPGRKPITSARATSSISFQR